MTLVTCCYTVCRSHALTRRMKEREKEAEADARDRHKEREEIEELRKKLVEEGHPDPDAEINKRQNPDNVSQEESMDTQEHNSVSTGHSPRTMVQGV